MFNRVVVLTSILCFFFFNDTATTEIYTLSLHDALPISNCSMGWWKLCSMYTFRTSGKPRALSEEGLLNMLQRDRKSTRLNSSHGYISYAVFCLKKKKKKRCSRPVTLDFTDTRDQLSQKI